MIGNIKLKVIIENGTISEILCDDTRIPLEIEVVEICDDYSDVANLREYRNKLHSDKLKNVHFMFANFSDKLN